MRPIKIIIMLAALAALYVYVPPLFAANAASPTGFIACLAAMFFLGFVIGEFMEFCADRVNLYRRL